MTPIQAQCLEIIRARMGDTFQTFGFVPASVMATIQVESSFRPNAYRWEPRLGEASYGLMQVLASTAKGLGLMGAPRQLYQPKIGILYGMHYIRSGWDYLKNHLGREPTLEEWAAGYNEGYGAAARGEPDPSYAHVWLKAREYWINNGVNV